MNPIQFKKTTLYITKRAVKQAETSYGKEHGRDFIEAAQTYVDEQLNTIHNKGSKNIIKKLVNSVKGLYKPQSKLTVFLDVNQEGSFIINTQRLVNGIPFIGKPESFSLPSLKYTYLWLDKAVRTSKEGVLANIKAFNEKKKLFKI